MLPTGRNLFSVDTRSVPTATAWDLGWRSAQLLVEDHLQRTGDYPKSLALSAWGTANMGHRRRRHRPGARLHGLPAELGPRLGRLTGFEVLPLAALGRPRVDVTFRVSGFFRDAFPEQIDLLDSAARAVMALDEPEQDNPAAARWRTEQAELVTAGDTPARAARRAGARVYGSAPGAYGAGLQAMIDERLWHARADLAQVYLDWGGYAYGAGVEGDGERDLFAARLKTVDGGGAEPGQPRARPAGQRRLLSVRGRRRRGGGAPEGRRAHRLPQRSQSPRAPGDPHPGRGDRPRGARPGGQSKWIAGVMRHGYKGAFEIAATVDYLFAFAATTHAVKDHHFDAVYAAFVEDEAVRAFMADANPHALRDAAARLQEAVARGLWRPKSNSAGATLERLAANPEPAP